MDLISLDQDDCFQDVLRDDSEDLVRDKEWFAVFLVAQSKYGSHCSFLHDESVFNVCGNPDPNTTIPYHRCNAKREQQAAINDVSTLSANDDIFLQTWSAEDSFLHG